MAFAQQQTQTYAMPTGRSPKFCEGWPGQHWNKSKQAAREMERELGLKRPEPKSGKRYSGGHATGSRSVFSLPPTPSPFGALPPPESKPQQPEQQPTRPMDYQPQTDGILSGMSEAQRIDFIAACEGKITWRQYFERWGDGPHLG